MHKKSSVTIYMFVCAQLLIAGALTGCNTFGGRDTTAKKFTDAAFSPGKAQAEQRLREIVRSHIQEQQRANEPRSAPIIRRRPYYFKEYAAYPDGPDVFDVEFREIDSRIRPLMAEVQINKIRYSTRMHRKRARAESDTDFLRDTGVETLVYELRSGRWVRIGAIFDAHKTEEMVSGQWMPRRDETQRVIPSEDRPGWFRRTWQRIRGGE